MEHFRNLIKSLYGIFSSNNKGVNLISWATSIRWVGWGFVEYLIPIFLFSFVASYADSGLLKSSYNVAFLLVLPIVGAVANHIKAKYLIITGLLIYPFIGFSYYLAGVTGIAAYVVVARALNGLSFALDSTGRSTYFLRHVPKTNIGHAFGFFKTLTSFWWILAVLLSLVLYKYLEIGELFLFIIPTSLIAVWLISKIPEDEKDHHEIDWFKSISFKSYLDSFSEIKLWGSDLKHLAFFHFLSGITLSITSFFLPITLYQQDPDITKIILLMTIYSIPGLFGLSLGNLIDKFGYKVVPTSFFFLSFVLMFVGLTTSFTLLLPLMFLIGIFETAFLMSVQSRISHLGTVGHYGSISSSFSVLGSIAGIAGPVLIGYSLDFYDISYVTILLATVGMGTSIWFFREKNT